MDNLITKIKIMLKQIVIFCVLSFATNSAFANQLPALPEKFTTEPELINDLSDNQKKEQSFWQRFKSSLGFGEEENNDTSEIAEINIEAEQQDIPAIPSIDQIATASNSTETANNNEVSNLVPQRIIHNEAPGKGQTLFDQDFSIEKDRNIDELFAEFAEDALVAIEVDKNVDTKKTGQSAPAIDESIAKNITLDKQPDQTQEKPLAAKNNIDGDENNINDLRLPNFEKLLTTEQDNNKLNEIESNIEPTNNLEKAQEKLSIDNLPNIPTSSTLADNASSNNTEKNTKEEQKVNDNQAQEPKGRIVSFRDQIKRKLAGSKQAPQLTPKQLNATRADDNSLLSQRIGNDQLSFVNNEAKVLTLPNDDVVLGKLTEEAKVEYMDFSQYVTLFWENYERVKSEEARKSLENFVNNYDENFNTEKFLYSEENDYTVLENATDAIAYDRYNDLKVLLDNYDILQLDNIGGNNMLHFAAKEGNFPAAKLLLIRGIDMRAKNHRGESAMIIAKRYNHQHIVYLLKEAGYH